MGIAADRLVVARSLLGDRRCRERVEALIARVEVERVEVLEDEDVETALRSIGERASLPRAGVQGRARPKALVALGRLGQGEVFPGYAFAELRNGRRERQRYGVLCHSAVEVQSGVGCPFDCSYCPYASFLCVRLDVEDIVERVTQLARARPPQRLFKLNNRTDTLGLEPECGLAPALVDRFAELGGDRQLMLYSKGDHVDALLDRDHRGATVASFTLTPRPVAELLEGGAPSPARRLDAIGRMARAGYPIRVRFSPIVPLRGWVEAYRSLVEQLARVATPEMVTLWTLSMIELEEVGSIVPLEALDAEVVRACVAARERMRGQKGAPLPPELRREIYATIAQQIRDASPSTLVSLCLESAEVWDGLAGLVVPRVGGRFACNCGPRATSQSLVPLRCAR